MQRANIILTGASSGFGKDIAMSLADAGHRVFAGMRDLAARNAAVAAELAAYGPGNSITPVELDVRSDQSVERAVAQSIDQAGQIDVCINCAGIMWLGVSEAYSVAQFEDLLQTNLFGPFRMMKAVLPGMRERRDGLLLTITSLAGLGAAPGFGVYGAGKAALQTLTMTIGYEVANFGIETVVVQPGPFPTTNLANSQRDPAETDVVASYGESARFRERTQEGARSMPPEFHKYMDARLVSDLVRDIVAMPKGTRPRLKYVGVDVGGDDQNASTLRFQERFMNSLGLAEVLKVSA